MKATECMFLFMILACISMLSDLSKQEQKHYNALSEALVQTCTQTDETIRTYCTAPKTKKGK